MKLLAPALDNCSRELRTLIIHYGEACIHGNKDVASRLNTSINDCLASLQDLVSDVAKLESEFREHLDVMEVLEESTTLG